MTDTIVVEESGSFWLQLFLATSPILTLLVFILLPAIIATVGLVRRTDLSNFQLWSLFLMSWLVPILGPIATLITIIRVVPK